MTMICIEGGVPIHCPSISLDGSLGTAVLLAERLPSLGA